MPHPARTSQHLLAVAVALPLTLALGGSALAAPPEQARNNDRATAVATNDQGNHRRPPVIEARTKDVLNIKGRQFKDSNSNGTLDPYEDWRLSSEERAADLVRRMTLEERIGLISANSIWNGQSPFCPEKTELLCEADFDGFGVPVYGTTKSIDELGLRYLVVRDNPSAEYLARFGNALQEVAEGSRLGIPAVLTSNPRNHVAPAGLGFSEAAGEFSTWPGTLGLAATADTELVRDFAEIAASEWRAAGLQKGYMYQAEIASEPRWNRTNGTFGEHPELVADIQTQLVLGFQGEELGPESVSLTTKHFPGNGAQLKGIDSHYPEGKYATYTTPGSFEQYHLPPFQAAIDAGTRSIMTFYNAPVDLQIPGAPEGETFEQVGGGFNSDLQDYLREEMGFDGYVNTDSRIMRHLPWGVEDLTVSERIATALDAGSNLLSLADVHDIRAAVAEFPELERPVTASAEQLLVEIFDLGLFEDPYVDPAKAQAIAHDPNSQAVADEAHRKSVVLLRNGHGETDALPLAGEASKIYVEMFAKSGAAELTEGLKTLVRTEFPDAQIVPTPEEADAAIVWVRPSNYTVKDGTTNVEEQIALDANTGVDVARIHAIQAATPTIMAINMTNPWLLNDIEPGAAAVLATYDIKGDALLDVISGDYAPQGKLPMSVPASQDVIDANLPDVPGYAENQMTDGGYTYVDSTGSVYDFGFGLTY